MTTTFDWSKQFSQGKEGEALLLKNYRGDALSMHEDKAYDFDRADGAKIELKTDFYSQATGNFFIERWSVYFEHEPERCKPGSLWQSYEKDVDVFLYYYIKEGVYYEFPDLERLMREVEELILTKGLKLKFVQNKNYIGAGYLIKREWLKGLYAKVRI